MLARHLLARRGGHRRVHDAEAARTDAKEGFDASSSRSTSASTRLLTLRIMREPALVRPGFQENSASIRAMQRAVRTMRTALIDGLQSCWTEFWEAAQLPSRTSGSQGGLKT